MVEVEIRTPTINEETQEIIWKGLALVRVADGEITVWGDDSVIHLDSVMSVSFGKTVHPNDEPEEWARSLPEAYRSGDLVAVLLQDEDAPNRTVETDHRAEPELPDPPAPPVALEDERHSVAR